MVTVRTASLNLASYASEGFKYQLCDDTHYLPRIELLLKCFTFRNVLHCKKMYKLQLFNLYFICQSKVIFPRIRNVKLPFKAILCNCQHLLKRDIN